MDASTWLLRRDFESLYLMDCIGNGKFSKKDLEAILRKEKKCLHSLISLSSCIPPLVLASSPGFKLADFVEALWEHLQLDIRTTIYLIVQGLLAESNFSYGSVRNDPNDLLRVISTFHEQSSSEISVNKYELVIFIPKKPNDSYATSNEWVLVSPYPSSQNSEISVGYVPKSFLTLASLELSPTTRGFISSELSLERILRTMSSLNETDDVGDSYVIDSESSGNDSDEGKSFHTAAFRSYLDVAGLGSLEIGFASAKSLLSLDGFASVASPESAVSSKSPLGSPLNAEQPRLMENFVLQTPPPPSYPRPQMSQSPSVPSPQVLRSTSVSTQMPVIQEQENEGFVIENDKNILTPPINLENEGSIPVKSSSLSPLPLPVNTSPISSSPESQKSNRFHSDMSISDVEAENTDNHLSMSGESFENLSEIGANDSPGSTPSSISSDRTASNVIKVEEDNISPPRGSKSDPVILIPTLVDYTSSPVISDDVVQVSTNSSSTSGIRKESSLHLQRFSIAVETLTTEPTHSAPLTPCLSEKVPVPSSPVIIPPPPPPPTAGLAPSLSHSNTKDEPLIQARPRRSSTSSSSFVPVPMASLTPPVTPRSLSEAPLNDVFSGRMLLPKTSLPPLPPPQPSTASQPHIDALGSEGSRPFDVTVFLPLPAVEDPQAESSRSLISQSVSCLEDNSFALLVDAIRSRNHSLRAEGGKELAAEDTDSVGSSVESEYDRSVANVSLNDSTISLGLPPFSRSDPLNSSRASTHTPQKNTQDLLRENNEYVSSLMESASKRPTSDRILLDNCSSFVASKSVPPALLIPSHPVATSSSGTVDVIEATPRKRLMERSNLRAEMQKLLGLAQRTCTSAAANHIFQTANQKGSCSNSEDRISLQSRKLPALDVYVTDDHQMERSVHTVSSEFMRAKTIDSIESELELPRFVRLSPVWSSLRGSTTAPTLLRKLRVMQFQYPVIETSTIVTVAKNKLSESLLNSTGKDSNAMNGMMNEDALVSAVVSGLLSNHECVSSRGLRSSSEDLVDVMRSLSRLPFVPIGETVIVMAETPVELEGYEMNAESPKQPPPGFAQVLAPVSAPRISSSPSDAAGVEPVMQLVTVPARLLLDPVCLPPALFHFGLNPFANHEFFGGIPSESPSSNSSEGDSPPERTILSGEVRESELRALVHARMQSEAKSILASFFDDFRSYQVKNVEVTNAAVEAAFKQGVDAAVEVVRQKIQSSTIESQKRPLGSYLGSLMNSSSDEVAISSSLDSSSHLETDDMIEFLGTLRDMKTASASTSSLFQSLNLSVHNNTISVHSHDRVAPVDTMTPVGLYTSGLGHSSSIPSSVRQNDINGRIRGSVYSQEDKLLDKIDAGILSARADRLRGLALANASDFSKHHVPVSSRTTSSFTVPSTRPASRPLVAPYYGHTPSHRTRAPVSHSALLAASQASSIIRNPMS